MSQVIVENVKMKRMNMGEVRGSRPSKITKGEAASFVVAQEWASPPDLWISTRIPLLAKAAGSGAPGLIARRTWISPRLGRFGKSPSSCGTQKLVELGARFHH